MEPGDSASFPEKSTPVARKVVICLNDLKLAVGAGVSESKEAAAAGSEGIGTVADPAAVSLALAGASREKADAFLDDQRAFIADHRHHLHEQLNQIHLDVWEK